MDMGHRGHSLTELHAHHTNEMRNHADLMNQCRARGGSIEQCEYHEGAMKHHHQQCSAHERVMMQQQQAIANQSRARDNMIEQTAVDHYARSFPGRRIPEPAYDSAGQYISLWDRMPAEDNWRNGHVSSSPHHRMGYPGHAAGIESDLASPPGWHSNELVSEPGVRPMTRKENWDADEFARACLRNEHDHGTRSRRANSVLRGAPHARGGHSAHSLEKMFDEEVPDGLSPRHDRDRYETQR
jgi:hypothetical protein